MIWNWRSFLLLVLLAGPIAAYMGFGALWLWERGWILPAGAAWIVSGIVFSILASRWTKSARELLPPIDWDSPQTFSPHDRNAWELVQQEAERSETLAMEQLTEVDVFVDTGRRLARRLAAHYHPLTTDPIEDVPIVELLTALELAAEDLNRLCRQVPGGDLITPAHYKQAIKAAGYVQRANDLYGYLLPLFNPVTGLVRLGTQHLMVKPAWKNMQQNLLRWFFRAFVNRLGTHLIELYSGRLIIGADRYRRLTRKAAEAARVTDEELGPLAVAVAGARTSGHDRLAESIAARQAGDLGPIRARLAALGHVESAVDRLASIRPAEVPGYTPFVDPKDETARDRSTRREAVAAAVEADSLLLVVDPRRAAGADAAFARDWANYFATHPQLEAPPALLVAEAPADGPGPALDPATRSERIEAVRAALGTGQVEVLDLADPALASAADPAAVVLAALAAKLHRAERASLIRHLHRASTRSKARRLFDQVGRQGRRIWTDFRSARSTPRAEKEKVG